MTFLRIRLLRGFCVSVDAAFKLGETRFDRLVSEQLVPRNQRLEQRPRRDGEPIVCNWMMGRCPETRAERAAGIVLGL